MSGCIGCGANSFALKNVCVACYRRLTEEQRGDYYAGWLNDWRVRRILVGERAPVIHELKTHPKPFTAVMDGDKKHEVRRADRDYREADILHLREWEQDSDTYTGREAWFEVSHITEPGAYGLPEMTCVMSIKECA